jgi:lipid-binding SYLF domain-containing protein
MALGSCASTKGGSAQEKRDYAISMSEDVLDAVYAKRPEVKAKVEGAAGYGCFSTIGTNLIFVTTGGGYGVVREKGGGDTFMKMGEIGVGIGLGLKDFRALIVFHDKPTLERFITSGWEWGADADAAAKAGDAGAAGEAAGNIHGGMEVYQITESGVALSATISGTKYWLDEELN